MVHDRGRTLDAFPVFGHFFPKDHVPGIERVLGRIGPVVIAIRVPFLDRGVHIKHLVFMAPGKHVEGVDIPGQIDDHAAVGDVLGKRTRDIDRTQFFLRVTDAFFDPGREFFTFVREI